MNEKELLLYYDEDVSTLEHFKKVRKITKIIKISIIFILVISLCLLII